MRNTCAYCWYFKPCPGDCCWGTCQCAASVFLHEPVDENNTCEHWHSLFADATIDAKVVYE